MACDQIVFSLARDRINERSALTITARFRNRATDADVTPTNVKYRIDRLNDCTEARDWTSVTPGTTVSITTTPDDNDCRTRDERQRNLLTVAADYGLSTQFTECLEYSIRNLGLTA